MPITKNIVFAQNCKLKNKQIKSKVNRTGLPNVFAKECICDVARAELDRRLLFGELPPLQNRYRAAFSTHPQASPGNARPLEYYVT